MTIAAPGIVAFAAAIDLQLAQDAGPSSGPPRFAMVAYTGDKMRVGGWRHPVVVDLQGMSVPTQKRPIRMNHSADLGVGHTESVRVENGKLVAEGVISRDTPAARDVVAGGRNGFPWQASIGASVDEHEFVREGDTVVVNGKSHAGPVNVVRKSTLGEISFVDLGADGNTTASIAATAANSKESDMDIAAIKSLTDKHPAKAAAIVAQIAEGKTVDEIEAGMVEAARVEELAALKAAADGAMADLKAAQEANAKTLADLKAAQDEIAALKAHKPQHSDPGQGKGEFRRSAMTVEQKAAFIRANGRATYEALPA